MLILLLMEDHMIQQINYHYLMLLQIHIQI